MDRATIDEVQRAPEILRAIKVSVDEDRRPGRFLCGGDRVLLFGECPYAASEPPCEQPSGTGRLPEAWSYLSSCSFRSHITNMRAAGIREIKNKLSEYLRYVAQGEIVLVTDHGRVVAQLAPPPLKAPLLLAEDEALRRLGAAGKVRLPEEKAPGFGRGPVQGVPPGIDLASLLDELREDWPTS